MLQAGVQGGCDPDWYHRQPHTPQPDDEAPEAEWGIDGGLVTDVLDWGAATWRPALWVRYQGQQRPAHAVSRRLVLGMGRAR